MALLTSGAFAKALAPGLEKMFRDVYRRQIEDPPPGFYDIPLETLKNLWVAKYGSAGIDLANIQYDEDDFWFWVVTRITQEDKAVEVIKQVVALDYKQRTLIVWE